MTDSTVQQAASASHSSGKLAFKIFLWILALAVLSAVWLFVLASFAPAKFEFSSAGAILMACTPPVLLTFLGWTGTKILSAPRALPAAPPAVDVSAVIPEPPMPIARFRIGAWSALTPHGNVIETVAGTKARTKAFKPDKAIPLPSGYPAHAGIIDTLDLEAKGHAAATRLRSPRVMTMLGAILDDLHAQQAALTDAITGPATVYWLVPPALLSSDGAPSPLFEGAWKRSEWREGAYLLHMIPAADASMFAVLSGLQDGIDQSSIPYTIIVAADSLLDREELAQALALGYVFSSTDPQGFIPSEGAGGILLFNPNKTSDELWANAAIMGPAKVGGRDIDHKGMPGVMSATVTAAGKSADDIGMVVSDSDHRAQGSMAVIDAMSHVLTGLDPMEQRLSPMEYAGTFGAATDLVNLALAVELATEQSVLALSTCNGQCAAVVISPA